MNITAHAQRLFTDMRQADGTFDITKADEKFSTTAKFGEVINLPIGQVVINPTLYFNPEYVGKDIRVSKGARNAIATAYRNKVKMSVPSKMSSIINLSLNDVSPQRADDILNTLLDVYNDDAVYDKRIVAEATAKFITERLQVIGTELYMYPLSSKLPSHPVCYITLSRIPYVIQKVLVDYPF